MQIDPSPFRISSVNFPFRCVSCWMDLRQSAVHKFIHENPCTTLGMGERRGTTWLSPREFLNRFSQAGRFANRFSALFAMYKTGGLILRSGMLLSSAEQWLHLVPQFYYEHARAETIRGIGRRRLPEIWESVRFSQRLHS